MIEMHTPKAAVISKERASYINQEIYMYAMLREEAFEKRPGIHE